MNRQIVARITSGITVGIVTGLAAALMIASPLSAEMFSGKSNREVFRDKTRVLDTRASGQYTTSVRIAPPRVNTPTKWGPLVYDGRYRGRYLNMARDAARRHGVPEDLFARLVQQESNWNPRAQSPKGALGLAQLMPETARRLGADPLDPAENLNAGAKYLARQYREFGSWRLALAAYNAGPEAVKQYGGVPPYNETRNYVLTIWGS